MAQRYVRLDVQCEPTAGAADAALLHTVRTAVVVFELPERTNDWAGTEPGEVGVAVFHGCELTKFGYPNDEAQHAAPRYAFSEVVGSAWAAEHRATQEADRDRTTGQDYSVALKRHFVVSFHDDTFECLADDVAISKRKGSKLDVVQEEAARLVST